MGLAPEGSWFDLGDILYIDQPVGTGFSFTTADNDANQTYVGTMSQAGDEFVAFLKAFIAMHPDYSKRKLTLSGESYSGKYVPYFATRLMSEGIFTLENVMVGNPFTSPVNQRTQTHKVAQALGIIDSYNMDQIAALRRKCEKSQTDNIKSSDNCTKTLDYILAVGGGVFDKDARLFDYDYMAGAFKQPYQDLFGKSAKRADIFKALHVDQSAKVPVFEPISARVAAAFEGDENIDYMSYYDAFTSGQSGPNFLIYAGQWDNRDGPTTIESWITQTTNFKASDLYALDRQIYYINSTANGFYTGGYFRRTPNGKFTLMTVPKAGHYVPTDVLEVTKFMLSDLISKG